MVKGLPSHVEDYVLELYLQNISGVACSGVKSGGSLAVVEFTEPVGELLPNNQFI